MVTCLNRKVPRCRTDGCTKCEGRTCRALGCSILCHVISCGTPFVLHVAMSRHAVRWGGRNEKSRMIVRTEPHNVATGVAAFATKCRPAETFNRTSSGRDVVPSRETLNDGNISLAGHDWGSAEVRMIATQQTPEANILGLSMGQATERLKKETNFDSKVRTSWRHCAKHVV